MSIAQQAATKKSLTTKHTKSYTKDTKKNLQKKEVLYGNTIIGLIFVFIIWQRVFCLFDFVFELYPFSLSVFNRHFSL